MQPKRRQAHMSRFTQQRKHLDSFMAVTLVSAPFDAGRTGAATRETGFGLGRRVAL